MRRVPATVCSGKSPTPGQLRAGDVAVEAPEQLIAAADREQRRAVLDRLAERLRLAGEVGGDERLLAVLPAADVVEVDGARLHRVAEPDRLDVELVPAPARPLREHRDVAPVGVDVQVVGVEVADADLDPASCRPLPVVRDVPA